MAEFEGDEVSDFTVQLPSLNVEVDQEFARGTYMTLAVEVRVRSIRVEEDRKGNLHRKHVLSIEDIDIKSILTPGQRRALMEQQQVAAEAQADLSVAEVDAVVIEDDDDGSWDDDDLAATQVVDETEEADPFAEPVAAE